MMTASRYCSSCYRAAPHRLLAANRIRRDVYACSACGERSLVCMVPGCLHMARTGGTWDHNLCAEHDGTAPNLPSWKSELDDIEHFKRVLQRSSTNFLPSPFAASKLRRALLPSKADYLSLEHFSIDKVRAGSTHAVIFVNGFLSQGFKDLGDWTGSTTRYFDGASLYHLDWESTPHPGNLTIDALLGGVAGTLAPTRSAPLVAGLMNASTAWHLSMRNAEIAGRLLADAIARTKGWTFTLAGHSLGARVIHFALMELAELPPYPKVDTAYLLGGAVGGGAKDDACWSKALQAMQGSLINCYSGQDDILKRLYRGANVGLSEPAGFAGIQFEHERLVNFDCTEIVDGHTKWKRQFGEIMRLLGLRRPGS